MTDTIGHNSDVLLKSYVERIERKEDEKSIIGEEIKEIYTEAANNGIDAPALRKAVKYSMMTPEQRKKSEDMDIILFSYLKALGFAS